MPICKAKGCRKPFERKQDGQVVCSWKCSLEYAKQQQEKREKKQKSENRKALREFKKSDKPTLKALAQKLVNQYIRMRDERELCISCGHNFANGRQRHAGHFVAVSNSSLLRFDERNINAQCNICNDHKSGNLAEYRKGLIEKIGIEEVEFLESKKRALKNWTVEELQEIITTYRQKIKDVS